MPRLFHVGVFAALASYAAPAAATDLSEFERALPDNVEGMNQVKIQKTAAEGQVIAFYGGKAGRATVFVFPVAGEDGNGVTRASQATLLEATAAGLKEGTRALGASYWTGPVQIHTLKIDNLEMACTKVEMRQDGEGGTADQTRLLDRRCFTQAGKVVIGAYVTTPFKAPLLSALDKDQIIFIGAFAATLIKGVN